MAKIDLSAVSADFKPTLHDVHKAMDELVVGEFEGRMSLFTHWLLAECNVMMSGPRASGKTLITHSVMSFVGNKNEGEAGLCYTLTAGSDKSGWYQADSLNEAQYVVVLELNKIPNELKEVLKDWGEYKDSEYKTTETVGNYRKIKKLKLDRRPFVFCLADEEEENVDVQLASRLATVRTNAGIQQNQAVMTQQAEDEMLLRKKKHVDSELKAKLKQHIMTLPPLNKFRWIHPAADMFVAAVPPFFTDCRRDFPKYLSNTKGITRFYHKERIKMEFGKELVYFITPQDMYLNHLIFGGILVNSALKCNNIEREMMGVLQVENRRMTASDVQKEMKARGTSLSTGMVTRHLNTLADLGYTEKEMEGRTNQYMIGKMFQDFAFEVDWSAIIDHCKATMKQYYPTIADVYIKLFCNEPLVQNPFTGEMQNLLEIGKQKIKTVLSPVMEEESRDGLKRFVAIEEVFG